MIERMNTHHPEIEVEGERRVVAFIETQPKNLGLLQSTEVR